MLMKIELHKQFFRTALAVFLFIGLFFTTTLTVYGQAAAIRSNYVRLTNGGSVNMEHVGDPNGLGVLPSIAPPGSPCGPNTQFRYNYGTTNRFIFYTGLPVPDPANPGSFIPPTMTQNNPNAGPNATAFTVNNVTNGAVTNQGIFGNFVYHDLINSVSGAPAPDGVNDGYTGTATLNGFHIEHSAYITLNALTQVPDETQFLFTVTNTSAQARVFGLSWNVDTQIGYGGAVTFGDLAPFFGPGINAFRTSLLSVGFPVIPGSAAEQRYFTQGLIVQGHNMGNPLFSNFINPYANEIPDYIYGLHPTCNYSGLIRTGLNNVQGHRWTKADYFAVAQYAGGVSNSYYYGVNNGQNQGNDDSGHILRWNPRIIMPGETIRIGFAFGGADAENPVAGAISLIDQMAPSIISADDTETSYTNSPFTSSTVVTNLSTATLDSGAVVLRIPDAYLRVEPSMEQIPNWTYRTTDLGHSYYVYRLPGPLGPSQRHVLDPPVDLFVVPQCVDPVNTKYWLTLEVYGLTGNAQLPDPVEKNLFIPTLFCFCGGNGTAADPYQICTIEELAYLAAYVNAGHRTENVYYILVNDLDASEFLSPSGAGYNGGAGWIPIGDRNTNSITTCFRGSFDGNNKTIRNITINRPNQDYIGLFGCVIGGYVHSLGIENGNIVGRDYVGSLVGSNGFIGQPGHGSSRTAICYAADFNVSGRNYVGGLIGGNFNNSTIENCYATCSATGNSFVGGLLGGQQNNATTAYSYATGNVTGIQWVGGLAGRISGGSTIENCVAANNSVIATQDTDFINRISTGDSDNVVFNNNYANVIMDVKANGIDITTEGTPESGESRDITFFQVHSFYNTGSNWLYAPWDMDRVPNPDVIWRICDYTRFPFFQWQRGIACQSITPRCIFYVDHTKSGDGSSWENAYPNLADPLILAARQRSGAIPVAENDTLCEIYVAEGIYYPMHNADGYTFSNKRFPITDGGRTNALVLVPGMKIYGGFVPADIPAGVAIPKFGTVGRDGVTELSGDLKGDGINNAYHVIIGVDIPSTSNTLVDGFTISGGNANSFETSMRVNNELVNNHIGGGVYNSNASPEFINTSISGNLAIIGGGIYNKNHSSPILTNVLISGNSSRHSGGGMFSENSSPVLTNVSIAGNRAQYGGGLHSAGSVSPIIHNSIIWGNTAGTEADNVYNDEGGSPVFAYSLIEGSGGSASWNVAFGVNDGNNIDANPLFVAPMPASAAPTTSGDYNLQGGSPAILAGENTLYLTVRGIDDFTDETDLGGGRRLVGPTIDLGAYEYQFLTIIAVAGPGGTINPSGVVVVNPGDNPTFHFIPDACYEIYRVFVNGVNNPTAVATGSYTFSNVTENQTIEVTFRLVNYTTHIAVTIDYGESYIFGGDTLVVGGVYQHHLISVHGCDSLVILTLTIRGDNFVPVIDIIDVPLVAWVGTHHRLYGTVIPENATFKTIVWSIKDTGNTGARLLTNNMGTTMLLARSIGTVIVTATIYNGLAIGEDFMKDFEIVVKTPPDPRINLILYPNPTSGRFKIKNGNLDIEIATIQVYDATGRLISSSVPQYENAESKEIMLMDISHLSAGVYFLKIITDQGIVVPHKVVRQ